MPGSVSPVSDVPEFPAGNPSRVTRPSGSGGLLVYRCWSWKRVTISFMSGERVTCLRTSCLLWTCVVGVKRAVWTFAVDCDW